MAMLLKEQHCQFTARLWGLAAWNVCVVAVPEWER